MQFILGRQFDVRSPELCEQGGQWCWAVVALRWIVFAAEVVLKGIPNLYE